MAMGDRQPFATLDSAFETPLPENSSDSITIRNLRLEGMVARNLQMEAVRRGVSLEDMAKVFIEQGMYFWSGKV